MKTKPITVLVADDHAMVRSAISGWIDTIPELQLVREAANGEDAVAQALALKPDVTLMDVVMPQMDGIAATRAIIQAYPKARVLMVTSFAEKQRAVESIQAGAQGFILKDASLDQLLEAILAIAEGRSWFAADLARCLEDDNHLEKSSPDGVSIEQLTERELAVLRLLAQGCADLDIADKLIIGHSTVRFHIHQLLKKLHVDNRTQAALIAIRKGWVKL